MPNGVKWDPPKGIEGAAEVLTKLLSRVSQHSWLTGEVPVDWRLTSAMHIDKEGWKKDVGS